MIIKGFGFVSVSRYFPPSEDPKNGNASLNENSFLVKFWGLEHGAEKCSKANLALVE